MPTYKELINVSTMFLTFFEQSISPATTCNFIAQVSLGASEGDFYTPSKHMFLSLRWTFGTPKMNFPPWQVSK